MTRALRRLALVLAVLLTSVGLAAPATAATSTGAQYEAQIASLVNQARADAGLPALVVSVSISDVSREWSQAMAADPTKWGHNPTYAAEMPSGWASASENVAYGADSGGQYPAASIHENLMNSSLHRANILRASSTHLGVGVAFVTRNGYNYVYVTQNFGAYPSGLVSASDLDHPYAQVVPTPDVTGDRIGDAFAVDGAGRLALYRGAKSGALSLTKVYGTGWSALDVYAPGDWNGDGKADLVAATTAGQLLLYPGTGSGGLGSSSQIGKGWTDYRIVPAGDVNGDRKADLLAIDTSARLWLYPGKGNGSFGTRTQVGSGWKGIDLYAAGDMTRDGRVDVLGIDDSGKLYFYAGRAGGGFAAAKQVGKGWTGMSFGSGADLNGDGIGDLVGRTSSGTAYFYAGRVGGTFAGAVKLSGSW